MFAEKHIVFKMSKKPNNTVLSCKNNKLPLFHVVREVSALIHIKPQFPNARQSLKAAQAGRGLAARRLTPSAKGTSPPSSGPFPPGFQLNFSNVNFSPVRNRRASSDRQSRRTGEVSLVGTRGEESWRAGKFSRHKMWRPRLMETKSVASLLPWSR